MKILGIDPGIALVGYSIIEKKENIIIMQEVGVIRTKKNDSFSDRLIKLYQALTKIIAHHTPHELAIEKLFFSKNKKTAFSVSQARGVILLTCAQAGLKIFEYTPLEIKQGITGFGQANKNQVTQMITRLLQLETAPKPDDAADALAISVYHAHYNQTLVAQTQK